MLPWTTSPTAARSADAIRSNNAPAPRFRKKETRRGHFIVMRAYARAAYIIGAHKASLRAPAPALVHRHGHHSAAVVVIGAPRAACRARLAPAYRRARPAPAYRARRQRARRDAARAGAPAAARAYADAGEGACGCARPCACACAWIGTAACARIGTAACACACAACARAAAALAQVRAGAYQLAPCEIRVCVQPERVVHAVAAYRLHAHVARRAA